MTVAQDPDARSAVGDLHVSQTPSDTRIVVSGSLTRECVSRIDDVFAAILNGTTPVLLRIMSGEAEFGAGDALRQVLSRRRRIGRRHLAVWADEPLIRRWIPLTMLHNTPPLGGPSWDAAVPAPP
jgi:hypothetical protein